ncbi:MAG TPA: hypothetical protein VJ279_08585 [Hanamia sp.]|jgi:hypothetical protein|nr:hypothetical protein [Hanamia sp.]
MSDELIQCLTDKNHQLTLLLGVATAMVLEYRKLDAYHDNRAKCDWFIEALDCLIYKDEPIPFNKLPD